MEDASVHIGKIHKLTGPRKNLLTHAAIETPHPVNSKPRPIDLEPHRVD